MSQQGSDHHIWKQLGNNLDARRKLADDPEGMAIVRAIMARGHTPEAIFRALQEMEARERTKE